MAHKALFVAACSVLITASANAQWMHVDFDTAPLGMASIPTDFYSPQGITAMRLVHMQHPYHQELSGVETPAGLPSPASGRGIRPLATLAAWTHPFEFIFSTPIDAFSIHAFDGEQATALYGFRNGFQVASLLVPAEPGRVHVHMELGAVGGGVLFDTIVVDVTAGIFPFDPQAGPSYFNELSYHIVPTPPSALLVLGSMLALARRRRAQ